jgi:hypothetical protein
MYVNFSAEKPHSKYFSGEYRIGKDGLNNASIYFLSAHKPDKNIVVSMQDIEVIWVDEYGDTHCEQYYEGYEYAFPTEIFSDEPLYPVVRGVFAE